MQHLTDYLIALGTIISVFGMVWKMTGDMRKYCEDRMTDIKKSNENSIQNVYKRFDAYKTHLEETHVSKEVCGILHNQIVEDVVEIKSDVKKLLAKNGID